MKGILVSLTSFFALGVAQGASLWSGTISTHDVTDADFQAGAAAGLGSVANDGWYWASSTNGFFFHVVIGADDRGVASPLLYQLTNLSGGMECLLSFKNCALRLKTVPVCLAQLLCCQSVAMHPRAFHPHRAFLSP